MLPGIRLSTIARGAERIYIFEEVAPNDSWCLLYDVGNDNQTIGQVWRGHDIPSGRHAGQRYINAMRDVTTGSPEWFRWARPARATSCSSTGTWRC